MYNDIKIEFKNIWQDQLIFKNLDKFISNLKFSNFCEDLNIYIKLLKYEKP